MLILCFTPRAITLVANDRKHCVQPLTKTKAPDISFILSAIIEIKKIIRKTRIILKVPRYPCTTDEVILAEMETSGFVLEKTSFYFFSRTSSRDQVVQYKEHLRSLVEAGQVCGAGRTLMVLLDSIVR